VGFSEHGDDPLGSVKERIICEFSKHSCRSLLGYAMNHDTAKISSYASSIRTAVFSRYDIL